MSDTFTQPSIVVGVDGSRSAIRAALWAVDEAVSRDIALRLVSVIAPVNAHSQLEPAQLAAQTTGAEQSIHHALDAIESTGRSVKLEAEIVRGQPTANLLESARAAAMICIGAIGLRHFDQNGIGSTARALVSEAHCPVAVIRGPDRPVHENHGWIVVELDQTPESATVLACGVEEARLRKAPLRVLSSWQSRYTDVHHSNAVADGNRLIRAQLDRRLEQWKQRYPDLDVRPVAIRGGAMNFLAKNANSIQLVVVGAGDTDSLRELLGPTGSAALRNTSCSVLITDRQRLL
jgi:nucleotide-binding universal stress UspA family protein